MCVLHYDSHSWKLWLLERLEAEAAAAQPCAKVCEGGVKLGTPQPLSVGNVQEGKRGLLGFRDVPGSVGSLAAGGA
ncbi:hypothetical protein NDU88_007666 [Pleurodeles waltl]|uniref:Uncharacterized protein n=1 Tax=Pleurodeles waltl TaxID=8319 RepID=A0AAV7U1C5_PLEWA|nr:hypothetical protein NDU88_007666 [Pleurodeles waltl]